MQNMPLLLLLYNSHGSLPVQSFACESKESDSAVTTTAKKMDANNKH